MKYLLALTFLVLSSLTYAAEKKDTFSIDIKDGKLSEAASLVNQFCKSETAPITLKFPSEKVTIKAESITCKEATKLISDFDHK